MNSFKGLDQWVNPDLKLDQLDQRQGIFMQPRVEGEIDLIKEVRDLLISKGLGENVMQTFDTHQYITSGVNLTTRAQQWLLNRFWDDQFMKLSVHEGVDVRALRYALTEDAAPEAWLRLFKQGMLTLISEHQLPKAF